MQGASEPSATDSNGAIQGFFPATSMPDSDWWTVLWPNPVKVLEELGVGHDMDVIDLCCGDGLFTAPLARLARRVSAIDPGMLSLARERLAKSGAHNCTFIESDAYAVSKSAPRAADLILIANTFHGVPDKPRLAAAAAEVLKPHGRFVVINWHRYPREKTIVLGKARGPKTEMRMTPQDVMAAVTCAGLRSLQVVELPPYHYGAVFEAHPASGTKTPRATGSSVNIPP